MNRIVSIIISVIFLLMTQQALALMITSPKNDDTFKEGDTVKVVAVISDNDPDIFYVDFISTKGIAHCPKEITTHPQYECTFTIPSGSPKVVEISALGVTVESTVSSPWVSINVILPSNVTLQQLQSFTGSLLLFYKLNGVGAGGQVWLGRGVRS